MPRGAYSNLWKESVMGELSREEIERMEKELRAQASNLLQRSDDLRQQALAVAEEASRLRQRLGPVFV